MSWLNGFELMCYIIVAVLLVSLVKNRDYDSLYLFGAAAIVGFVMELAAVRVTGIYFYNPGFWLSVGAEPNQFPVFGGLMWGGVTVCALKLAEKLRFGKFMTAVSAGMLVVTMDILLDVAVIRLDGGFWTWVGRPINFDITQSAFMSVIWVNFVGYLVEVPAVTFLTQLKRSRVAPEDWRHQLLWMFAIALGGTVITGVGSGAALALNCVTGDWFSCIAFPTLWITSAFAMLRRAAKLKLRARRPGRRDVPALLFWAALYAYCIAALTSLGLWSVYPLYMVCGVIFAVSTLLFAISDPR